LTQGSPATPTGRSQRREVWRRYRAFIRRAPLLSIEWHDDETPARGWLVINSLKGGAAGGGTRLREGLTKRELVYLAKTMELKFVFSGPPIGGAKSGIDFDPSDSRRGQVLRRWFKAVAPQLRSYYGTGGDLNVDEVLDVIPCCDELGLAHPQQGIVLGHLDPSPSRLAQILASLSEGVEALVEGPLGVPERSFTVADLVTGYGVARSIIHLFERQARPLAGARIAVEGFGAVGGPCALYLARAGALIVGIADHEKVLLEPTGLDADDLEDLLRRREGKALPSDDDRTSRKRAVFRDLHADIFVAAAASGTLDVARLQTLRRGGIGTIACGANQPFREPQLGATHVQRLADESFTVIPDVVANCGMARAFSFLMQNTCGGDPAEIFRAVDETISESIDQIITHNAGEHHGLLAATLELALDRVEDP
jgi:glutamate dehydrogenase/leucine dehydrogenase